MFDSAGAHEDLAPVSDGGHTIELREQGNGFVALLDDEPLFSQGDLAIGRGYAQIGPGVSKEGDKLSGTIGNVIVAAGDKVAEFNPTTVCSYVNHGVKTTYDGTAFVASGTFERTQPSRFVGDCSNI
jgi:hypothetical protein